MCMVERKEILSRMKTETHKLINDNSDIFARCSCKCRFHKFFRNDSMTLRTRLTQKKVPSTRHSKLPRVRQIFTFSDDLSTSSTEGICSPCFLEAPTPASSEGAGGFLFNIVPRLPTRSPTATPMPNLELAQVQHYLKYNHLSVEVWGRHLTCVWHNFYSFEFQLLPFYVSLFLLASSKTISSKMSLFCHEDVLIFFVASPTDHILT